MERKLAEEIAAKISARKIKDKINSDPRFKRKFIKLLKLVNEIANDLREGQ